MVIVDTVTGAVGSTTAEELPLPPATIPLPLPPGAIPLPLPPPTIVFTVGFAEGIHSLLGRQRSEMEPGSEWHYAYQVQEPSREDLGLGLVQLKCCYGCQCSWKRRPVAGYLNPFQSRPMGKWFQGCSPCVAEQRRLWRGLQQTQQRRAKR